MQVRASRGDTASPPAEPHRTSRPIEDEGMTFPGSKQMKPVGSLDHVRPAALVAGFLHQTEGSVFPLDVIAGSGHMMPRQGNHQLAEDLVIPQPLEDLGQERFPQEATILE